MSANMNASKCECQQNMNSEKLNSKNMNASSFENLSHLLLLPKIKKYSHEFPFREIVCPVALGLIMILSFSVEVPPAYGIPICHLAG